MIEREQSDWAIGAETERPADGFNGAQLYAVSKAQYGTLRAYNPSAKDGTPEDIRDYRVWLTPKG